MHHASESLTTDLYELTMLQSYQEHQMNQTAVFEFFVRDLPEHRGYLVAAGLEPLLEYLQQLHLSEQELDWLRTTGFFTDRFLNRLLDFRFTGDAYAMPEGTVFFPHEPVVQVVAPISEAQLIETRVMNLMQFQILIASKAARCVEAAQGKQLVDFGLRRAHGREAGNLAARANYLAGFAGTSTVSAGMQYDIPLSGTMAHSFVQAHDSELTAFEHYAASMPNNLILLIDTFDTENAARAIVDMAKRSSELKNNLSGVRLDSGDLSEHAFKVRDILDHGGLSHVKVLASGGLDEWKIEEIMATGAPVDGFGVGSKLDTSNDAPYLDCAYKLVEYADQPRRKFSSNKINWPGRKQVYRYYDADGNMQRDVLTSVEEHPESYTPLLQPVMRGGEQVAAQESLQTIRDRLQQERSALPDAFRQLRRPDQYPVSASKRVKQIAEETDRWIQEHVACAPR